jgi:hypothetical protein
VETERNLELEALTLAAVAAVVLMVLVVAVVALIIRGRKFHQNQEKGDWVNLEEQVKSKHSLFRYKLEREKQYLLMLGMAGLIAESLGKPLINHAP